MAGSARIWWNWQTRYFEVVVGQPVQIQVLLCAPFHWSNEGKPSDSWRLVRGSEVASASKNHPFLEESEIWLRRLKPVVKVNHLLLENPFRLIAILGEWIESLSESVVQPRQNCDLLSRNCC